MKQKFFRMKNNQSGFTLIEILVVIGIIAVLAAIVIVAINPARQFAQARNTQRQSNIEAILNSIGQRIADNKGLFIDPTASSTCIADIPTTTPMTIASNGGVDLRPCLVPSYMSELPVDPTVGRSYNAGTNSYTTGYTVFKDPATGRITVTAPTASTTSELDQNISLTR